MEENLFETATRLKLRFESPRGLLTVEQLWDVPLRGAGDFTLNEIAKAAHRTHKDLAEENFVDAEAQTPARRKGELAFKIVRHVIEVKLKEEAARQNLEAARREKARLLEILAEKKAGALSALTEAEIQKRIDDLGV